MTIERQVARFMTDVADAVAAIKSGKTTYGDFYVSEIRFGYEGEDTGYRVVVNEHDDYDLIDPQEEKA